MRRSPSSHFVTNDCDRPKAFATSTWVNPAATRAFRSRLSMYWYPRVWTVLRRRVLCSIDRSTVHPFRGYPNLGHELVPTGQLRREEAVMDQVGAVSWVRRASIFLLLALTFPVGVVGAQDLIRVAVEIDDEETGGVFQSIFASAFRRLGDVAVVSRAERPTMCSRG